MAKLTKRGMWYRARRAHATGRTKMVRTTRWRHLTEKLRDKKRLDVLGSGTALRLEDYRGLGKPVIRVKWASRKIRKGAQLSAWRRRAEEAARKKKGR
jgi:hypothetical protein